MASYTVIADKLNGREQPDPGAPVGAVRFKGDKIDGDEQNGYVASGDGLFYKIEFLDRQDEPEPDEAKVVSQPIPAEEPNDDA